MTLFLLLCLHVVPALSPASEDLGQCSKTASYELNVLATFHLAIPWALVFPGSLILACICGAFGVAECREGDDSSTTRFRQLAEMSTGLKAAQQQQQQQRQEENKHQQQQVEPLQQPAVISSESVEVSVDQSGGQPVTTEAAAVEMEVTAPVVSADDNASYAPAPVEGATAPVVAVSHDAPAVDPAVERAPS